MGITPNNTRFAETFTAEEDLTGKAGYFVKPGAAADGALLNSSAGQMSLGMIITPGSSGQPITVLRDGRRTAACASATYTFGQLLSVGADAKLKAASAGEHVVAISREVRAVASADPLDVEVIHPNYKI